MTRILLSWLALSVSVWLTSLLVSDFRLKGLWNTVVAAGLLGLLSWILGRLLYPLVRWVTLGTAFLIPLGGRWLVTAILLALVTTFTNRIQVKGIRTVLVSALVMSVFGTIAEILVQRMV